MRTQPPIQEHRNRTSLKTTPCRRDGCIIRRKLFRNRQAEDLTELPVSPRTYSQNLSTKLTTKYLDDGRDRITHIQTNFGPSFIASIAWSDLSPQERELADCLQCMSRPWKIDIVATKGEAYWHYGAGRSAIPVVVAEKLSHVKQVKPVGQSVPWLNGNAYEWFVS